MNNENNANFTPPAPNFKTLYLMPFKQLTNFPYIEKDFDAVTDYQLLSKVVDYLNQVIANNNEQNSLMVALRDAYIELQNYINTYFDNLDVQDEINIKLEQMAESGQLTLLIKEYVDPIYQAYENQIDTTISQQNSMINAINTKVNNMYNINPIPVSSTDDMTDEDSIYVLTTDGYWYYYNTLTSEWTRGALYQAAVNDDEVNNLIDNLKGLTNLYDVQNTLLNKYLQANGTQTNESSGSRNRETMLTSYFIPIIPESKITMIQEFPTDEISDNVMWHCVGCYQTDETWISRVVPEITTYTLPNNKTYFVSTSEVPLLCTKVKINFRSYGKSKMRVIYGEVNDAIFYQMSDIDFNTYIELPLEVSSVKLNWERGTISTTNGAPQDSEYRIRTTDYIRVTPGDIIGLKFTEKLKNDYEYAIRFYNKDTLAYDKSYETSGDTGWIHTQYFNEYDGYIKILMRKYYDATFEDSEIPTMGNTILLKVQDIKDSITEINQIKNKIKQLNVSSPNNIYIKSINHRGYSSTYPENTIPAFIESKRKGFEYVETDVRFTYDNVPVLLHDSTINRTGRNDDGTTIETTIAIDSITYEQALDYDFGIWKDATFEGTKIPTLEEFLVLCKKLNLKPYLELKVAMTSTQLAIFEEIINRLGMKGKVTYISDITQNLRDMKLFDSKSRLGYIRTPSDTYTTVLINLKTDYNETFYDTSNYNIDSTVLAPIISNNIGIEVWTIDNENTILNLPSYVTGVTSNSKIANDVYYNSIIE